MPRNLDHADLLTTGQAGKLIGASPATVAAMIDRGELVGWRVGSGRRVRKSEVLAWLAMRGVVPPEVEAAGRPTNALRELEQFACRRFVRIAAYLLLLQQAADAANDAISEGRQLADGGYRIDWRKARRFQNAYMTAKPFRIEPDAKPE
jgi:excisionase family DNA binding protein